jgi:hypothetical protein
MFKVSSENCLLRLFLVLNTKNDGMKMLRKRENYVQYTFLVLIFIGQFKTVAAEETLSFAERFFFWRLQTPWDCLMPFLCVGWIWVTAGAVDLVLFLTRNRVNYSVPIVQHLRHLSANSNFRHCDAVAAPAVLVFFSETVFINVYGPRNRFLGIDSASLCSLTNRAVKPARRAGNRFLSSLK